MVEDPFTDDLPSQEQQQQAVSPPAEPQTVVERVKEFVEKIVHPESTIKLLARGGDLSTLTKALMEVYYKNRRIEGLVNTVVSKYNVCVRTNPQASSNSRKQESKVVPILKIINRENVIYLSFPTMCDFNAMSMFNLVFTVSQGDKQLLVITKSRDQMSFTDGSGKEVEPQALSDKKALVKKCSEINTLRQLLAFVDAAVPHVKLSEASPKESHEEMDTPRRDAKIDELVDALTKAVASRSPARGDQ